jgi:hypothetical protein
VQGVATAIRRWVSTVPDMHIAMLASMFIWLRVSFPVKV